VRIAILLGLLVHLSSSFFGRRLLTLFFAEDVPLQPFMHDGDLIVIHQGSPMAAPENSTNSARGPRSVISSAIFRTKGTTSFITNQRIGDSSSAANNMPMIPPVNVPT